MARDCLMCDYAVAKVKTDEGKCAFGLTCINSKSSCFGQDVPVSGTCEVWVIDSYAAEFPAGDEDESYTEA